LIVYKIVRDHGMPELFSWCVSRFQWQSKDVNPLCVKYRIDEKAEGIRGSGLFAYRSLERAVFVMRRHLRAGSKNLALLKCETKEMRKVHETFCLTAGPTPEDLEDCFLWWGTGKMKGPALTAPVGTWVCPDIIPKEILITTYKENEDERVAATGLSGRGTEDHQ
jgi:hypothetical protein